jgi:hypothetical protein
LHLVGSLANSDLISKDLLPKILKTLISKVSLSDGLSFASAFGAYSAYLLGKKERKAPLKRGDVMRV